MKNRLTASPDFSIRPPETPIELETFFLLKARTFRPDEDADLVAAHRRRVIADAPDFHSNQLRGAYLGNKLVGCYALLERNLCLGSARLLTGCISGVATHPDYRHQGIATAMMQDAISYASSQQYALLFLHGLSNFYHQFGYIDVLEDTPKHAIDRKHIPEQPSGMYTVRSATVEDAPTLLAVYQAHYASYLGSFAPTRTLQRQEHLLRNWFEVTEIKPQLALTSENELHGYLMLSRRRKRLYAYEVAASTWPAALTLLRHHSHLLDAEADPPQELWWPLPSTDSTFYFLADHLLLRSEMYSYPNGGWMARPVHLPTLLQSLLPLWQDRWQQRPLDLSDWSGILALTVDDFTSFLELGLVGISVVEYAIAPTCSVRLSQQVFAQLIFGFRPITWAISQAGQSIPAELVPLLNLLFPPGQACIAGSDAF